MTMIDDLPPEVRAWKSADVVPPEAWPWPHFTPQEWACKGSGWVLAHPATLDRLERLRAALEHPLPIASGYRSPWYNLKVSTTGQTGPHTTGRAADLRVAGELAYRLVGVALGLGFTGIGVAQRGAAGSRFIHLDDIEADGDSPRPRIWSY